MGSFGNKLKNNLKTFFEFNKQTIFLIIAEMIFGVLIGVFCILKLKNFSISRIPNFLVKNYLINFNIGIYILTKVLLVFALFILLYVISFLKFGSVLTLGISFYLSCCLGASCCIIINHYNLLQGIVLSVVYFAFEFVLLFFTTLFFLRFCYFNKQLVCYGNCQIKSENLKILLFGVLAAIIIIILQSICLSVVVKLLFIN